MGAGVKRNFGDKFPGNFLKAARILAAGFLAGAGGKNLSVWGNFVSGDVCF